MPDQAFKIQWGITDSIVVHGIIQIVKKMAKKNNLAVIDLCHGMSKKAANFSDSIHTNEKAAKVMAGIIVDKITQKYIPTSDKNV